jgi:CubicO group peptidase (beta-lactamase class C family)
MGTRFGLQEAVREAHARTGVPGVAAGLSVDGEATFAAAGVLELGRPEQVAVDTPFRIASITKPFVATLAAERLALDDRVRALLSHTAGLRCESTEPLPAGTEGLWSYSNAGYWAVAEALAEPFEAALQRLVLDPLGLAATGFEEPARPARGHVQEGESGHRAVPHDLYPRARRPSGGLWSTAADLVRFGARHLSTYAELQEPQAGALGAHYALGWWTRELANGCRALDHEGSSAGYQSLLLLVPEQGLVLAVLTNSWRGSGLIRRVVEALGLGPRVSPDAAAPLDDLAGAYALDGVEAVVEPAGGALRVAVTETDPVTRARLTVRFDAVSHGGAVFGFAGGRLMSHRIDFPRAGFARIGWAVLPRVSP